MGKYKFIDLFAGLGGFNIALREFGMCVFASEIDIELRELYQENFGIECHGDITKVDVKDIPKHDILCAGFPCQPFSKAGNQKGLSDTGRGDMINEIIRILKHHQPKYFILENVPNIKKHDNSKTWRKITGLLESCSYQIQDYILSPHHFGIPHKRERIFIVGTHNTTKCTTLSFNKNKSQKAKDIKSFLLDVEKDTGHESIELSEKQKECLETWQEFITVLPKDKSLPKFPIWYMEFGANYPLDKCPYFIPQKELEKYRGAFGRSLKGLSKEEQLQKLPVYAVYKQKYFPQWKINYINKNRAFWKEHKTTIKHLIRKIKSYINSWQKLEWNAGDEERDIFSHILQFRSSGIRVKSNCSIPSLVLTGTQTPVIGWEKRYLQVKEAQKLQGFDTIKINLSRAKILQSLGNAVNTIVVGEIIKELLNTTQKSTSQSSIDNNQKYISKIGKVDKEYA